MNPAPNLVLVGPMGAGKSSIGRRLAARLGLTFVDADHEVERLTGVDIPTIFACEGEAGFRARERSVLATLMAAHGTVVATGGGAVLDAETRAGLAARGFVVHLHADVAQQLQRLVRDHRRPLLAVGDRPAALRALAAVRDPLYAAVADLRFETGNQPAADAAAQLGQQLERLWQRTADPSP
ncbi:MAG TPA: shikimate kinase [Luteimonas sp.]|nr:shikimate kinase [Luteimonas sp.]